MKNLFSIKTLAAAFIACGVMFTFASCEDDPCKDVTCVNGTATESAGSCSCVCEAGYNGSDCSTVSREKFVGSYQLNESCPSGSITNFNTTIAASSSTVNKVLINGFGGFAVSGNNIVVEGTISGTDGRDITITANQSFDSGNLVINSGSGTINSAGTVVTINYSYTLNGSSENCSGTYTKQ